MKELSPEKKKKMLQAIEDGKITDEKSLALYQILDDAKGEIDRMEEIKNEVNTNTEEAVVQAEKDVATFTEEATAKIDDRLSQIQNGHTPTDNELRALIIPLIPTVQNGHTPTPEEIIALIRPLIPEIKNGVSPTKEELTALILSVIPKDEPETGEQIVEKINTVPLEDEEHKIGIGQIAGLIKRLDGIARQFSQIPSSVTGRDIFEDIDISSQLNGVLKTFSFHAVYKVISVDLSSFPFGAFQKTTDYTWDSKGTITFTSEIDASTQLSTGQKCILTVINA